VLTAHPIGVLVDATELTGPSRFRGIGRYLVHVLTGLASCDGIATFALTTDAATLPAGVAPVRVRRRAPERFADLEREHKLPREIRRAVRQHPVNVLLAPATHLPRKSPVPVVATLHDVVPLVLPGYEAERARWARLATRYREAEAVISVSEFTAAAAVSVLGVTPARITVAHLGIDAAFSPGPGRAGRKYLLVVGGLDPRKRHELAFAVLDECRRRGADLELLVVGNDPRDPDRAWDSMLEASGQSDHVRFLGRVAEPELIALYRGAAAVLVMSSLEGFGLPALEAMACGAPVVAFDNSATTEVAGTGLDLVPEADVDAAAARVLRLVQDTAWRSDAVARGLSRASEFTWEVCVARHVEAIRGAVARA
jgi:glycosyltransferase involved in cell wall biosynthesis